jgi:hypothetical protein
MPRFRLPDALPPLPGPVDLPGVRRLCAWALSSAHFYLGHGFTLNCSHAEAEECSWELFQGRLLEDKQTRQRRTFESWFAFLKGPELSGEQPILSLKLDATGGCLYVVRGLECYVWEGYDSGGNVYLSRECRKWVRELVGTIELERFATLDELRDEILCQLFQGVVGSSRLPLTSVEAPLPGFSFGYLFYCGQAADLSGALLDRFLTRKLAPRERAKLLETFLHSFPLDQARKTVAGFGSRWSELGGSAADLVALLRLMFNEVSLSPWTDLTERTLLFLRLLNESGYLDDEPVVDFLASLLIQIGRHLTAYDLTTFHHRGANYPDALLLDLVLKEYLGWIERRPELWERQRRRRALRQAWLLRRQYEGHPVPDMPTSPGENNRVLPASHPRVAEEQLTQPAKRTRLLYANDPLPALSGGRVGEILARCMADLQNLQELRELGLGLFLDRPFALPRPPAAPDGTLLLTSLAFSCTLATQRLRQLERWGLLASVEDRLPEMERISGLQLERIGGPARMGTVTLTDAGRAARDFVFLHTTAGSIELLLAQYDFTPLADRMSLTFLTQQRRALLARSASGPGVVVYDDQLCPRLELRVPEGAEYVWRAGQEYPRQGLEAIIVEMEGEPVVLPVM